jgi:pimeloyl-ACP methyl ester carboxylesterase
VLASPAGAVTDTTEEDIAHIRRVFDIDDHQKALAFIDRLLARGTVLRHVMAWGVRRKFTHPDLRALLDAIEPSEGLSPEEIRSLEMPLLFLWGEHERILPPNHLDFWHAHLPEHAERERPLGMGHSPFLDRPGALTRRILEFIEKV